MRAGAAAFAGFLVASGSFAWAWVYPLTPYGRSVATACNVVLAIELATIFFLVLSGLDPKGARAMPPGRARALARVLALVAFCALMLRLAREPGAVLAGVGILAALLPNHFLLQWKDPRGLQREAIAAFTSFFAPAIVLLLFVEPPRLGVTPAVERLLAPPPANGLHVFLALAATYFALRALWTLGELLFARRAPALVSP